MNQSPPRFRYAPLLANLLAQTIFGLALYITKKGMVYVNYDTVKFLAFRFTTGFAVRSKRSCAAGPPFFTRNRMAHPSAPAVETAPAVSLFHRSSPPASRSAVSLFHAPRMPM